jgi:hypothetical protein
MKFNSGGDYCGNTFGPSPFASLGTIAILGLLKANTIAQTGTIAESTGSGGMDWAFLQQNNLLRYAYHVGGSVNTVDSASALTRLVR